MATIKDIVVDSAHPAAIARFWARALDDYEIAPYDEAELERLREMDLTAEVERLCGLGATVHMAQPDLVTLLDPEGNEFCVTRGQHQVAR
ncbi:VOC family protein [Asanoa sp. NPDC049573]|uniref:VOC family protein n=1 Tax=Asanoa sp. NPDC049573 TaxID=3155396 RepID=UPI003436279F